MEDPMRTAAATDGWAFLRGREHLLDLESSLLPLEGSPWGAVDQPCHGGSPETVLSGEEFGGSWCSMRGGGGSSSSSCSGGSMTSGGSRDSRCGTNSSGDGSALASCQSLEELPRSRRVHSRTGLLRRARQLVLEQHRSFHDAFAYASLNLPSREESPLGRSDFCSALGRLGIGPKDSDRLFWALVQGNGSVSLATLRGELMSSSRRSLLWELRCRLVAAEIHPSDPHTAVTGAFTLAEVQPGPDVSSSREVGSSGRPSQQESRTRTRHLGRRRRPPCLDLVEGEPSTAPSRHFCLNHAGWSRLCQRLGMPSQESELLFNLLGGKEVGWVDMYSMLATVRNSGYPDGSMERFARRLAARYDSPEDAFNAFCKTGEPGMRWAGFCGLAHALRVDRRSAFRLWSAITLEVAGSASESGAAVEDLDTPNFGCLAEPRPAFAGGRPMADHVVDQVTFVRHMLLGTPHAALGAMQEQLCLRFGDLSRGRAALEKQGLDQATILTPQTLQSALWMLGIRCCDTAHALRAVLLARDDLARGGYAKLDELFAAMHDLPKGKCERRDDTLSFWQQLRGVATSSPACTPLSSVSNHASVRESAAPLAEAPAGQRGRRRRRFLRSNPFTPLLAVVASAVHSLSRAARSRGHQNASPADGATIRAADSQPPTSSTNARGEQPKVPNTMGAVSSPARRRLGGG